MTQKQIHERNKRIFTELFLGEDIESFTETHLGIDYRKALQGELTPYIKYLISQSLYFESQKNGRTDLHVVQELVYSRCIELALLEKWKGKLILNGSDKDNLITRFATNQPDLWEIGTNNHYEVISTYGGLFLNKEFVYLTKGKLYNLCRNASTSNQFLILVDVMYQRYAFLPIKEKPEMMVYADEGVLDGGYTLSLKGLDWFSMDEEDIF